MKRITDLQTAKRNKNKISMVTCYDFWSANILKETDIDVLLVGDSVSMVVHGFESTVSATAKMMEMHTAAVARAETGKLIVTDLPFLAHRGSRDRLIGISDKLMKAGAHALKIEAAPGQEQVVQWLSDSGIPMVGHLGLTPQYVNQFGGYKVQGRNPESFESILNHALALQEAGCHALVLECVPTELAKAITKKVTVPTIGIGAGIYVDGQVLVLQDLLGLNNDFKPKFVRQFAQGHNWMFEALNDYSKAVTSEAFPSHEESFK